MKLALFDLDGTLIPGDSDHAFGEFMTSLGWVDADLHRRRNDAFYQQYQAECAGTLQVQALGCDSKIESPLYRGTSANSDPGFRYRINCQ